jgi:hydrogenase-4 component B
MLAFGLGVILVSGLLALALERRPRAADRTFRLGIALGCLVGAWTPIMVLAANPGASAVASSAAMFGLDALSAWFAIVVLGVGATTAVYGTRDLAPLRLRRRVGVAHLLLAILIIAMIGVVTAQSVVAFLATWESMAVAAYLLIIFEHDRAEARRAGFIYLVLTHVTTVALLGMFGAWGSGISGVRFHDLAIASAEGRAPTALILVLALLAFGIKAGAVPGHFWLPDAHAAAPSHVSALLSGVMIKTGIYGLLRVLSLIGAPPAAWAWTVLLLGVTSAVLGVLWALTQHDIKRLLAYHSVENIGIILLGIGLGALGTAYHQPLLALLGFTGALLHTLNHALFKSLLFLGAGAVYRVSGTRDIERLGGLSRVLPRTAWAFLIGSIAIVGLPPLNGFVSEWMIFRGLFAAGTTPGILRTASVAATGLALTGALALACFTKLHGVVFLGTPRQPDAMDVKAERGLVAPQAVLAGACIAIGVAPMLVIPAALRAASVVLRTAAPLDDARVVAGGTGRIAIAVAAFIVLTAIIWTWRKPSRRSPRTRSDATWSGAFPAATARMQYTASSYAASLLAAFGPLTGLNRLGGMAAVHVGAADPFTDRIGGPLWSVVRKMAAAMRRLHTRQISWYLLYVISALLALLVYLWFGAIR